MKQLLFFTLFFSMTIGYSQITTQSLYTLKPNDKIAQMNENRLFVSNTGNDNYVLLLERGSQKWAVINGKEYGPLELESFGEIDTKHPYGRLKLGMNDDGILMLPDNTFIFNGKTYGPFSYDYDRVIFNPSKTKPSALVESKENRPIIHIISNSKTYEIENCRYIHQVQLTDNGEDIDFTDYDNDKNIRFRRYGNGTIVELGKAIHYLDNEGVVCESNNIYNVIIGKQLYEPLKTKPIAHRKGGTTILIYEGEGKLKPKSAKNNTVESQVVNDILKQTVSNAFGINVKKLEKQVTTQGNESLNDQGFYIFDGKNDLGPFVRYSYMGYRNGKEIGAEQQLINGKYVVVHIRDQNEFVKKDGSVWAYSSLTRKLETLAAYKEESSIEFEYNDNAPSECAYKHLKIGDKQEVIIGNKHKIIPFEEGFVRSATLGENKEIKALIYSDMSNKYRILKEDGKIQDIEMESAYHIVSDDRANWLVANMDKTIINGKEYKEVGFAHTYNPKKNSFQWLALNGQEIIIKEFKLGTK